MTIPKPKLPSATSETQQNKCGLAPGVRGQRSAHKIFSHDIRSAQSSGASCCDNLLMIPAFAHTR